MKNETMPNQPENQPELTEITPRRRVSGRALGAMLAGTAVATLVTAGTLAAQQKSGDKVESSKQEQTAKVPEVTPTTVPVTTTTEAPAPAPITSPTEAPAPAPTTTTTVAPAPKAPQPIQVQASPELITYDPDAIVVTPEDPTLSSTNPDAQQFPGDNFRITNGQLIEVGDTLYVHFTPPSGVQGSYIALNGPNIQMQNADGSWSAENDATIPRATGQVTSENPLVVNGNIPIGETSVNYPA